MILLPMSPVVEAETFIQASERYQKMLDSSVGVAES